MMPCPKCGSTNIVKVEDKTTVLTYVAHKPVYAKRNKCLDCGYEWRPEEEEKT